MKINIYPFISKANQVFFFAGSLTLLGMIAVELLKEIWPRDYPMQQVKIVDKKSDPESKMVVEYRKVYEAKIKDTHVIELRSRVIDAELRHEAASKNKFDMFGSGYKYGEANDFGDVVNVLFVDVSNDRRMLFESDRLIASISYADFDDESYTSTRSSKNIYSVVSKDSNDNGYLDDEDKKDIYVSEYNGEENVMVMSDIQNYRMIANDLILIQKKEKKGTQFFEYDVTNGSLLKLNTDVKLQEGGD